MSEKERFLTTLRRLGRFEVRLGRLEYRGTDDKGLPIFQQKRIDLLMGLDIATISIINKVDLVVLLAGDSDFVPAVKYAKHHGIVVRLAHGPTEKAGKSTYHQELWDEAGERLEINAGLIDKISQKS